jgi:hypothetical protein
LYVCSSASEGSLNTWLVDSVSICTCSRQLGQTISPGSTPTRDNSKRLLFSWGRPILVRGKATKITRPLSENTS